MMMALRCPAPLALPRLPKLLPWLRERMALRIDVELRPDDLHADLDELQRRLTTPGDALFGLPEIGSPGPGFVWRYREADGEHYVYVEDVLQRKLAGYTVFNRLIEVGRKADPHLRAPHSKYAPAYQRRGLATAVYKWGLGAGICLMSGARQSPAAHGLWCALSGQHELHHVHVERKTLQHLGNMTGSGVSEVRDDLNTRMLLLGQGWSLPKFMQATGMRPQSLSHAAGRAATHQ